MKQWMVLALVWAGFALASGGNEGGHGGDALVSDFRVTGAAIVSWLEKHPGELLTGMFRHTLDTADIRSTDDKLVLDDGEKDAVNYPATNRIVFNRGRWRSIVDERQKWTIVIHEVLGLMRMEDGRYQISSPIVEKAMPSARNAEAFRNTMPFCMHMVSIDERRPDGHFFGVQLREQAAGKYTAVYVFGRVTFAGRVNRIFEMPIAKDLACRYSKFHAGAMNCDNGSETWFTVLREAAMRDDSDREPYVRFRVTVRSPELAAHYSKGGYRIIDEFNPTSTKLTQPEWNDVSLGSLPRFKSEMSWREGDLFTKVGPLAFGGALSIVFGQESCQWVYPVRAISYF